MFSFIETKVTARLPQAGFADMGRVDQVVAVGDMLVVPVALDLVADHAAVGVPEDQTLPNFVIGAEEVKFLAELAVVAFLASSSFQRYSLS